jgi:hypothetical protein
MKRSEVYSWRVATEVKAALEQEARREGQSVGGLLERITTEWLDTRRRAADSDGEQARLHAVAAKSFGTIAGGNPGRSSTIRTTIRRRLAARGREPALTPVRDTSARSRTMRAW